MYIYIYICMYIIYIHIYLTHKHVMYTYIYILHNSMIATSFEVMHATRADCRPRQGGYFLHRPGKAYQSQSAHHSAPDSRLRVPHSEHQDKWGLCASSSRWLAHLFSEPFSRLFVRFVLAPFPAPFWGILSRAYFGCLFLRRDDQLTWWWLLFMLDLCVHVEGANASCFLVPWQVSAR